MKFAARVKDVGRTLEGRLTITLECSGINVDELTRLLKLDKLDAELKRYHEKRSLDANAYYWLLIGKIGKVTGDNKNRIHNVMLDRYGQLERMPDGSLIPFCIREDIDHLTFPYPHLKPTQKTLSKGGRLYRWYYQIKGSSEYDTSEMSALIDGVVSECKEMGIETLPTEELERMMDAYDRKMERSDR